MAERGWSRVGDRRAGHQVTISSEPNVAYPIIRAKQQPLQQAFVEGASTHILYMAQQSENISLREAVEILPEPGRDCEHSHQLQPVVSPQVRQT